MPNGALLTRLLPKVNARRVAAGHAPFATTADMTAELLEDAVTAQATHQMDAEINELAAAYRLATPQAQQAARTALGLG